MPACIRRVRTRIDIATWVGTWCPPHSDMTSSMYVFCQRVLAPLSLTATSSTPSSFAILLSLSKFASNHGLSALAPVTGSSRVPPLPGEGFPIPLALLPLSTVFFACVFRVSYRIVSCLSVCLCVCLCAGSRGRRFRKLYSGSWWVLPFFDLTEAVESTQSEAEWITVQAGLVDAYTTSGATATPVLW